MDILHFLRKRKSTLGWPTIAVIVFTLWAAFGRPALLQAAPPNPRIRFERISLEQGLSQSSIYHILQDGYGLMWFATEDGLNKYDGYEFTIYKPIPGELNSLAENNVTALYMDKSGALWIGTEGGGLDRFEPDAGRFTHYVYRPGDPNSLSSNFIRAIYQDHTGALWIGTLGGLNKFDPEKGFTHYRASSEPYGLSSNTVLALYQDRQQTLWIGTQAGLDRFDYQSQEFTHYYHRPLDPYSLSSDTILSIYQDSEGVLWFGTDNGLNRFDRLTHRFTRYQADPGDSHSLSHNVVRAICQDSEGVLWVGTDVGLSSLRQGERFTQYYHDPADSYSLSGNSIRSIYEDRSGVLWVGTAGGGINRLDRFTMRFAYYGADPRQEVHLSNNMVRAIYEDASGAFWVGMGGGGLDKLDRSTGDLTNYSANSDGPYSLRDDAVRVIYEDPSGGFWIGTEGGLDRFDRATQRFYHHADVGERTVLALYQDRRGFMWIGTTSGLYRYERSTGQFAYYCVPSNNIRAIYEDREGVLWIGTGAAGLCRLDREGAPNGSCSSFPGACYQAWPGSPNSLSDNGVLSLYQDRQGTLWVGTAGGGLNRFDRAEETFTHYGERDGLPNNVVYGILEDEQGCLWLSTNKGVGRFDPRTQTFKNYDVRDGLQDNEFNGGAFYKSRSGEMFFGGINGLTAFYPDQVQDNTYHPPVVLTSLTQGMEQVGVGQAIESVEQVTFRWPNNFFEFEFAALSFSQPEKNQYAYMLENFDSDWNYIGTRRFGRYTNLPGGAYTLKLKGANNDGVWNEQGASIKIVIVPPVWETWWFKGVVALGVLAGVMGAYGLRLRSIEARNRELEAGIEQRTAELRQEVEQRLQVEEALRQSEMDKAVAAERSRLARDLHDVVTQTLFSAGLVAEALPPAWTKDQAEGLRLLQELRQLTQGALAEMRTLLLELRPTSLVETSLGDLLRQLAEAAAGREGLPVQVSAESQCVLPPDVHIAFYRIAQEALNNITKHARASRVTIRLCCAPPLADQDAVVEMHIGDDGRGFDPTNVPSNHLGLGIMRERAASVGASFALESSPGHGTRLAVRWQGKMAR